LTSLVTGGRRRAPPAIFVVPALFVGAAMMVPIVYLVLRATEADMATVAALVWRARTFDLLVNTAALVAGVLALTTAIAAPLAWLTARTDLKGKRAAHLLVALPLAVPGYVMAYALIGLAGHYGFMNALFGWTLPRPQGWLGATLALSLYTFPYIYLNLRASLAGIDQSLEESARALGSTPRQVFLRVTLPHLRPALFAGWLVVGLYVIGDFGAVALMRYEVFSYALYTQYAAAYDRVYAAWLALILVAIAVSVIWWESRLREGAHYARTGTGAGTGRRLFRLGTIGNFCAWAFIALVVLASLGLPVAVLGFWLSAQPILPSLPALGVSFWQSVSVAVPAAILAGLLALPVAIMAVRYPSPLSLLVNRLAFVGYAVPPRLPVARRRALPLPDAHPAGDRLRAGLPGSGAGPDPLGALPLPAEPGGSGPVPRLRPARRHRPCRAADHPSRPRRRHGARLRHRHEGTADRLPPRADGLPLAGDHHVQPHLGGHAGQRRALCRSDYFVFRLVCRGRSQA
jgi:iron(III) transport system permease protein